MENFCLDVDSLKLLRVFVWRYTSPCFNMWVEHNMYVPNAHVTFDRFYTFVANPFKINSESFLMFSFHKILQALILMQSIQKWKYYRCKNYFTSCEVHQLWNKQHSSRSHVIKFVTEKVWVKWDGVVHKAILWITLQNKWIISKFQLLLFSECDSLSTKNQIIYSAKRWCFREFRWQSYVEF